MTGFLDPFSEVPTTTTTRATPAAGRAGGAGAAQQVSVVLGCGLGVCFGVGECWVVCCLVLLKMHLDGTDWAGDCNVADVDSLLCG